MQDYIVNTRVARLRSYIVALLITGVIFGTAFLVSNYFNDRRIAEVRAAENNISVDTLSAEIQFDLLAQHSCQDISENSVLSSEMYPLGQRLAYLESQQNVNEQELTYLKSYYSLMQIKDLLLMQQVAEKCRLKPVSILYFYSNKGDCTDCEKQGYILTALSEQYPSLRIYSFDYNLPVSALKTLIQIHDIENKLPALIVNNKAYYGLQTSDKIHAILPALAKLATSTTAK